MKNIYKRHRFPPPVIQYAVWLYYRFNLSIRDVEDLLAERRDTKAAKRFFQRFLKSGGMPREIVTDKLRSYGVAHRSLIPDARHNTEQYANNRAELSHQPTRVRERGMRRFKSIKQAQRFLETHAAVHNLFNLHRHSLCRKFFKLFRLRAFATWVAVTGS
jgi:putative transposase